MVLRAIPGTATHKVNPPRAVSAGTEPYRYVKDVFRRIGYGNRRLCAAFSAHVLCAGFDDAVSWWQRHLDDSERYFPKYQHSYRNGHLAVHRSDARGDGTTGHDL